MRWFKRKTDEPTFKSKVEAFWSGWGRESDRPDSGLAWVFGPGDNG